MKGKWGKISQDLKKIAEKSIEKRKEWLYRDCQKEIETRTK